MKTLFQVGNTISTDKQLDCVCMCIFCIRGECCCFFCVDCMSLVLYICIQVVLGIFATGRAYKIFSAKFKIVVLDHFCFQ